MARDLRPNFVSAQYLENKLTEFHQILYMHCSLLHEKRCSGAIVRFSDNSNFELQILYSYPSIFILHHFLLIHFYPELLSHKQVDFLLTQ